MNSTVLRRAASLAAALFYRIDRIGTPPARGALLLLPNHPNALLDPALVWATAERDVRFLAKSTLFAGPFGALLRSAGAVPVYRRSDDGVDPARNREMFATVAAALAAGDAVCLFPEGRSHSRGRLEPLRTGAARIALNATGQGAALAIVTVGLNFDRKATFRSRVTVAYGPPFDCRDLANDAARAESDAVMRLTGRIADHMRELMIEADPAAEAALVARVDRLYASARGLSTAPADRLERRRSIAAGMQRLLRNDPGRYEEILLRLRRYDGRMQRFGLRDAQLDGGVSWREAVEFGARELLLALVLLPLCVAGLAMFVVPYTGTALAARMLTDDEDVRATVKVVGGALIYAVWAGLATAALSWRAGVAWTPLVFAGVVALAVASLFAIERESAVVGAVRSWSALKRTDGEAVSRLHRKRSELADVLDDVRRWLEAEQQR